MDDFPHDPTRAPRYPLAPWARWSLFGLVAALLIALSVPQFSDPPNNAEQMKNLNSARGVFFALKSYAATHAGHYPRAFAELDASYLNPAYAKYRDPDSHRLYDWLYLANVDESSPSHWIVLASPTDQVTKSGQRRARIVVKNDSSASLVLAKAFDAALAEQMQAMMVKSP